MYRGFAVVVSMLLLSSPVGASSFQIYEASAGSGNTAFLPAGFQVLADIDFDAGSAEGGSLLFGAGDILIEPFGGVFLVDFTCELVDCSEVLFTPGDQGSGRILINDPDTDPKSGIFDLGTIKFDTIGGGGLLLRGCNYTDANAIERQCDPFTLVQAGAPEPGSGALLGAALCALAAWRRRRA